MLSDKTFYEVRISQSVSQRDTSRVKFPAGIEHISEAVSSDPIYDQAGFYRVYRESIRWERFERRRLSLTADLSSQVHRRHFVKAGLEFIRYNNWFQHYLSGHPFNRFAGWYGRTIDDTGFFSGQKNKGVTPYQIGTYLQDKIELNGMIVNAGLRLDMFVQNTEVTDVFLFGAAPMYEKMTRARMTPTLTGPTFYTVSPRLGVSHPLGEKSIVRFFFGKFTQTPSFQGLFYNSFVSEQKTDDDLNGNGQIDSGERWNGFNATISTVEGKERNGATLIGEHNPDLPSEETVSFEVGFDWNFTSDYVIGLTSYYKRSKYGSHTDMTGWGKLNDTGFYNAGLMTFAASNYKDVRGIELNLKKRFSHLFAFTAGLNIQWADQGSLGDLALAVFVDSLFVARGHYWETYDIDPTTGAEIPVSLREQAVREGKDPDFYIEQFGSNARQQMRNFGRTRSVSDAWSRRLGYQAEDGVLLFIGKPNDTYEERWDQTLYTDKDRAFWERLNSTPGYPGTGEGNIMVILDRRVSEERKSITKDRRFFGSLALLFATPKNFGPRKVLGDLRANLIYRLFTGTPFENVTTGGLQALSARQILELEHTKRTRSGPMHTRVDLNVEKALTIARQKTLTLAVEVYNLFNQRDVRSVHPNNAINFSDTDWLRYGLTGARPTDSEFVAFGETFDINNYWDAPREIAFSVRFKW